LCPTAHALSLHIQQSWKSSSLAFPKTNKKPCCPKSRFAALAPEKKQPQAILHNVHYIFASHSLPQAQHKLLYNVHYLQGFHQIAALLAIRSPTHPTNTPTTLSMVQGISLFTAMCLRQMLHTSLIPLQAFRPVVPPYLMTFHSIPLILQHQPQQRTQEWLHSFHSVSPALRSIPQQLWRQTHNPPQTPIRRYFIPSSKTPFHSLRHP
jgi:hypothetical protein